MRIPGLVAGLAPGLPIALVGVMAMLDYSEPANANPTFARQTGMTCTVCHFQRNPKLNAFGRKFKASGYSLTSQEVIESDNGLSITPVFNAGLKSSFHYVDDRKATGEDLAGRIEFPAGHDIGFLLGGRLAKGIGGFAEFSGGSFETAKVSFTHFLDAVGVDVGVTPFSTADSGAPFGFDLMNAGVYAMSRPFELASRTVTGGIPQLALNSPASGVSIHAAGEQWFLAYTPYSAVKTALPTGLNLSQYVRGAWMPSLFGWDIGLGGGYLFGTTRLVGSTATTAAARGGMSGYRIAMAGDTMTADESQQADSQQTANQQAEPGRTDFNTRGWFVDSQVQGKLLDRELGVYAVYGVGDQPGRDNVYGGVEGVPTAFGVDAEYRLVGGLSLLGSYGRFDTGAHDGAGSFQKLGAGLNYLITDNISLQPVYEVYSGKGRTLDNRFDAHLLVVY